MKHNKKRNTAFIYEILTRELTQTIVSQDSLRKGQIVTILKDFFSKGTVVAEELTLYRTLLETRNMQPKIAERLLEEAKEAHGRIDESALFDAQSRLIAAINKGLGTDVWATFVPNFKSLATISTIFNSTAPAKKRILYEDTIIKSMNLTSQSEKVNLQPIDNLVYQSFVKNYNEQYSSLLKEQKSLLGKYISSFSDDGLELRGDMNLSGSIIPTAFGSFDLGSSDFPFRDLHVLTSSIRFYDSQGEVGKIQFTRDEGMQIKQVNNNIISSGSFDIDGGSF